MSPSQEGQSVMWPETVKVIVMMVMIVVVVILEVEVVVMSTMMAMMVMIVVVGGVGTWLNLTMMVTVCEERFREIMN